MFRTRQEVDKHVNSSLRSLNNESERCLRGYAFAKLYFNVGDYEHAVRYVNSYLSVKPKSPEGHNLLGKALEKLGRKQSALEAYRTSLQLDPNQNNLVLKVCDLLAQDDLEIDSSGARYFCDLAQSLDPKNPIVTSLKEKLISSNGQDPNQVSEFLLKELENRPTDVNLRVRLLKNLLENNKVKEAYKHAFDIEQKKLDMFDDNISWYEIFAEVLVRYQKDASISTQLTWEFWFLSTSVLEKLALLSLSEHTEHVKTTTDYVTTVFNFDQSFLKASENVDSCPDKILLKEFLNHYEGQVNFHFSVLAFKQAKKDLINFKEVENFVLPLLFTAYNLPVPDTQGVWFSNLPANRRLLVAGWHKEAAFRRSQAGNILLGLAKDRKNIVIEKASQYSTGMWREQIFKKLFVKRDQQLKTVTSFFNSSALEPVLKLPDVRELITYNEVAQLVYPGSLHHYIWLAKNYQDLADFTLKSFDGLQYSVKNLNNCAAETLNILDVQSFIYCATLCAQSKAQNADHSLTYFHQNRPSVLPVSITATLGTLNQAKFLSAAYKMYKNEYTMNMGEIRLILIKGIEVVRCVGNHGLDVKLLVHLATIFADRVGKLTKHTEIEANSARAELYWKTALPLLEKLKNEHAVIYPSNRMFEFKGGKDLSLDEILTYIEKGKLFLGVQLMKKEEYEKAMTLFEGLKDPYASFYQSQIYKAMADSKTNQRKENVTSEMRSQNIILLSRARDCLYLTLDRLREPSQDRNHPLNAQLGTEIEKTERLLSRIDPDCSNRNECDGMSDENVSDDSVGEHYLSSYTHHASFANVRDSSAKNDTLQLHSTPLRFNVSKREARPSPERLDAQIRQLMASKDMAMSNIVEQNKMMVELQQSLTDEIRGFKDAVKNLTSVTEQRVQSFTGNFEDVKKMVDDLTHSVDDRLQSVTDMVQEMRRELNEIKKDQNKNTQLSVEDLYDLDQDYNSLDYNLGPNMSNNQTQNLSSMNSLVNNLYPNYPRLPQAPPVANLAAYAGQGLYPGLYPGLPYPHLPLGLQAGLPGLPFLPPPADQQQLSHLTGLPQPLNPNLSQLTQIASQALSIQSPAKESPKPQTFPPNNVSFGQAGLGSSAAASISQPMSIKDSPKTSIFSSSGYNQTGLLGQGLSTGGFSAASATGSSTAPVSRAPPVNVVITSSDPLPSFKTTTSQPILSVTIPPQHIKGATIPKALPNQGPHNYQIPMPVTTTVASTPSILNQPSPFGGGQNISSSVSSPIVSSAQTASPNVSLGIHIEKTLDKTFSTPQKTDTSLNRSNVSNISSGSVDEYDPRPDFQPIIPLPDEVPVTTGEEKETELLCQRAKLFRLVTTNGVVEWKERGIGNIKILFNPETGKVRILMRRDQVHKICANHFLTKDMILSPMTNNDKAYIWAAQDFADEQLSLEKFCVRFKTPEEAKKFAEAFELAKSKIQESKTNETVKSVKTTKNIEVKPPTSSTAQSTPTNLGGFKFMSTPTFKPKEEVKPVELVKEAAKEPEKVSPFASFTFGSKPHSEPPKNLFSGSTLTFESPKLTPQPAAKTNTPQKTSNDDDVDEYVPTQEFKPVIEKLPDLVEIKTGEENAEVLFEERSKLFRWDTSGEKPEWKERGLGNIKILKEDTIRLVMRREQVHKVCLNHQVLKNMPFNKNSADAKAVVWHAKDYSEGVLKAEMFTARFKNEEIANKFLATLQKLQTSLDESNQISGKHHKAEAQPKTGFGDKFKPAKGSWECKNCYINNDSKTNTCMACDTPKVGSSPKKAEPTFSFTAKPSTDSTKTEVTITPVSSGWGNQFKPAAGSWECKTCLVSNTGDKTKCASCETPKDGAETQSTGLKGISLDTGGQTFTFGMPVTQTTKQEQPTSKFTFSATPAAPKLDANSVLSGFGDSFKPKPGSWDCKACYVRNEPTSLYCLSCEAPKDDTIPKKDSTNIKGVNLETPGLKFSFGMPATTQPPAATSFGFGATDAAKTAFSWKPKVESASSGAEDKSKTQAGEQTSFSSPKKAEFEFKPRSPRRISSGQGDESDASYVEEEEANVQFKPVVPLPDIVEVKTGEENEEVLYTHRAKLFRFVNGEWKERGIGDVKILKDNVSGKLRVVMRREQVFKICLNHWLTKDVEYLSKDEKTWLFHAADFSEGELSRDQFCLRFKSNEVAVEFKKAVDDALAKLDTFKGETPKKVESTTESDSDVEFVSETQVTPEEEEEALKLMLPPKFMAYRQKSDCVCEQCQKDDEYLKDLFGKSSINEKPVITSANTSVFFTPTSTSSLGTPSTAESVFGTPPITQFSFGSPTGEQFGMRPPKSESLRQLLQKPSFTPQATDQKTTNLFSLNSEKTTPQATDPKTSNLFSLNSEKTTPQATDPKTTNLFSFNSGNATPQSTDQKTGNLFSLNFGKASSTSTSGNVTPKAEGEKDVKREESTVSSTSVTPVGSSLQKSASGLFTQKSDNIFRITGSASSGSASPSIFGDSTGNIFSTPKDGSTPNFFGSKAIFGGDSDSSKNLFSSSGNLFSLNKASPATGNIFGTAANISSNNSLFGSSPGLNANQPQASATPLFGASSQLNIFGTSANTGNIFGQGVFGNKAGPKVTDANLTFGSTTTNLKDKDEVVLKADSNLSFANLAQASKTETAFTPKDNSEVPFAFLGAGAPVFGSLKKEKTPSKTKEQLNKTQEGSDNEEVEGADHDPHFEPIVPLPDAIVVSTGEEEESVVFNDRAKLFRYDNSTKEWKERGIGELKVLFHPENKTYRLLLRREQVHKVVLNQRITSDLELQPMSTSDKAWIWAGMNYSEDETKLEQLAVKFKNTELAQAFKKCIDETVLKAAEIQANRSQLSDLVPTTVQDLQVNDEDSHDDYGENEDYNDEEEDDEDEDDDERTVMFNKRCTLSEDIGGNWQQVCMGDLQVYYDPELFTARICIITDNGEIVSNTIIGVNTVLEIKGKECTWKSVEWADSSDPHWRTLKATFSSEAAAQEFHSNYLEGVNYAHEVGIADELSPEVDTESDH